ncbi:MAG: hypothetical protein KBG28_00695 [Kofleriaceae bacterium]|jgi:hypothetical protein|nr:hypothetical protein [Kofleriaceae bacterium]MBP6838910.1 hypothetical protein [Kofleriaceae bacterium]MBP9202467.1 hypothetical protein [Kofleriaceae bacterium]
MTQLDLPFSTICFHAGIVATWDNAENFCDANFRARFCSLGQWRTVVCRAGAPNPGRSWLDDVVGAGSYATVAGCTSDSVGVAPFNQAAIVGPCCLEFMKY